MFKPLFQDAAATAIIEGLAVARYSREESKWNVVFLRNCGHYPKLTIREVDRQSGKVIAVIKTYEIAEDDSISITVSDPDTSIGWKYETGGAFHRNPGHDARDLRWMLDMEKLSGGKVPRTGTIETNSLFISNGCFYTSIRTKRAYRKRWIDSSGKPSPVETIGLTGRTFGSDFKGSAVRIEVAGSSGFSETLNNEIDSRFEIIFDNTCVDERQPQPHETDFHFYYKLFDSSQGKVEILPPEEPDVIAFGEAETSDSEGDGDTDPEPESEQKRPACQAITDGTD